MKDSAENTSRSPRAADAALDVGRRRERLAHVRGRGAAEAEGTLMSWSAKTRPLAFDVMAPYTMSSGTSAVNACPASATGPVEALELEEPREPVAHEAQRWSDQALRDADVDRLGGASAHVATPARPASSSAVPNRCRCTSQATAPAGSGSQYDARR